MSTCNNTTGNFGLSECDKAIVYSIAAICSFLLIVLCLVSLIVSLKKIYTKKKNNVRSKRNTCKSYMCADDVKLNVQNMIIVYLQKLCTVQLAVNFHLQLQGRVFVKVFTTLKHKKRVLSKCVIVLYMPLN